MKLRFWQLWVYRLFIWVWTPIFKARPDLHKAFLQWGLDWQERRAQDVVTRRAALKAAKRRE